MLCTLKTSASVFLNLLFILLTFSLDTEAGQAAPEAQTLKCTPSLVDSTTKCNISPQKGPVFYKGLKRSPSLLPPESSIAVYSSKQIKCCLSWEASHPGPGNLRPKYPSPSRTVHSRHSAFVKTAELNCQMDEWNTKGINEQSFFPSFSSVCRASLVPWAPLAAMVQKQGNEGSSVLQLKCGNHSKRKCKLLILWGFFLKRLKDLN